MVAHGLADYLGGVNETRHVKGPIQNKFNISFGLHHCHYSKKQLRSRKERRGY